LHFQNWAIGQFLEELKEYTPAGKPSYTTRQQALKMPGDSVKCKIE